MYIIFILVPRERESGGGTGVSNLYTGRKRDTFLILGVPLQAAYYSYATRYGGRGFLSASVCEHEHRKQFEVSVGGQWRVEVSVDGQSNTSRLLLCGGR